ncbi:hypothetical protein EWF95_06815 [Halonotius roseus]|uniref:Uncharacterized protein n=1 Tax=Halonotius roseus TaxID=2511997 RepID=A0A544QMQ6_9EURY|nr:hypothetical protein EWF95_06815 [Halonotius roseus]
MGLKGAGVSPNPDDASTTANGVSEERSESRESRRRGLSRCSQFNRANLNSISESAATTHSGARLLLPAANDQPWRIRLSSSVLTPRA